MRERAFLSTLRRKSPHCVAVLTIESHDLSVTSFCASEVRRRSTNDRRVRSSVLALVRTRHSNPIPLALPFARRGCHLAEEHQIPLGGSDSVIITKPSVENQGTPLAHVAVAGAGNQPHLITTP